jgi:hypothetical protein
LKAFLTAQKETDRILPKRIKIAITNSNAIGSYC